MGIINVYNTVSNEHKSYHLNGKLKNVMPDLDFKHSIIIKAGNRVDGDYEVTEEDVLYCRVVPGSTAVIAVVAIVTAVVAVGVGVGSAIYAKKQSDAAKAEMEKAQKDAANLAQKTQQLPFIRGAKNKNALGNAIQFPMGSVYNTPYNLTNGFYSIDGNDGVNSYYNAAFSLGFGNMKITKAMLGEETICSNSDGISAGVHSFDAGSLYYDSNLSHAFEVAPPGRELTLAGCNTKVSSTYMGAELKHEYGQDAEPIIFQAAENAKKIQVCIQFSCLRTYDSEHSTWAGRKVKVVPYWSNNNGQTWVPFTFEGSNANEIDRNTNHTIRFVATKEFTAAESYGKSISIKVVKETPKAESGSQEDCALLWYQTFEYDPKTSNSSFLFDCPLLSNRRIADTTRVAYRIQAGSNTDSIIDELHCMTESYARTWNGTQWSDAKSSTRNPASWIYEIMTTSVHSPSMINAGEIDVTSLGAVYDYCVTNNFYTDGIITNGEKKLDIITKICQSINVDMFINKQGLYEFAIDKIETTPVALLNPETIKSITFSKDMGRKTNGTKVTFTNRDTWCVDTFYSMLDGEEYDYTVDIVEELSAEYVTTYEHAYKMAQRKQRQAQLMPIELKADVGLDGDYYPLFSTVRVQLPQLFIGYNSSVIKQIIYNSDNKITGIVISDLVQFNSNTRYGVTIQATTEIGKRIINSEVTGDGKTKTLLFTEPLTEDNIMPEVGNHLSFGPLDSYGRFSNVAKTMKIYGIEPNGNNGYTLTLRDYNEDVYSYGGEIPAYKSNVTKRQKPSNAVTIDDVNRVRQEMNTLQETLINAYQMITFPIVVDADNKSFIIEVDDSGKTVTSTSLRTQIYCKQGDENRDFVIGEIELPGGWTSRVEDGVVIFNVGADVIIRSGTIKIPVVYRPAVSYSPYEDEEGNTYVDENNNPYMETELAAQTYTYDLYITYLGYGNGSYLGMIYELEDIPEVCSLNDYFVWAGDNNTVSTLSYEGKFRQGCIYKYIGVNKAWSWEKDEDIIHMNATAGDVLGLANADLKNNNSKLWEYLDHLTANSVYTDMIVANQAFIDNLVANDSFINKLTANSVFTNKIKATTGFFDNITSNNGYFTNVNVSGILDAQTGLRVRNIISVTDTNLQSFVNSIINTTGNIPEYVLANGLFKYQTEFVGPGRPIYPYYDGNVSIMAIKVYTDGSNTCLNIYGLNDNSTPTTMKFIKNSNVFYRDGKIQNDGSDNYVLNSLTAYIVY